MGDGEALFLVLSLLYLSDCLLWVRKRSVAFVSPWCRRWRVANANPLFGNERGGLLFLNPLPPLGHVFLSDPSPVSVSPVGVCTFDRQPRFFPGRVTPRARSLTFAEITRSSTDSAFLLINNRKFAKCATTKQAKAISELINATIDAAPSAREGLIYRHITKQFAVDEAASILRNAFDVIKPIQFTCCIFFLFLFVATPILVSTLGLLRLIVPVAAVIIVFAAQISIMFYRGHKELYPHDKQERIESVIKMVLCPPVSIRTTDLLTKHLLSEYSPVVLGTLFPDAAAQRFVRSYILDLQHPLADEARDETSAAIISWAATTHLSLCIAHISRPGVLQPEVLTPPAQDGNSISYCPRCRCQYVVRSGQCPDCPGVGLLAFPDPSETDVGGAL